MPDLLAVALAADRRADAQESRANALEDAAVSALQESISYRQMSVMLMEMWYRERTVRLRAETRIRDLLEMKDDNATTDPSI